MGRFFRDYVIAKNSQVHKAGSRTYRTSEYVCCTEVCRTE